MTERFLKFPLFYLPNEEIQSRKIQNNLYNFEFSHSGSLDFLVRMIKEQQFQNSVPVFLYTLVSMYVPPY